MQTEFGDSLADMDSPIPLESSKISKDRYSHPYADV